MSDSSRINSIRCASMLMGIAGVVLILLGLVFAGMMLSFGAPVAAVLVGSAFISGPAVLYFIAAVKIKENRIWPIIVGLVVGGLHLLFALLMAVRLAVALAWIRDEWVIGLFFILAVVVCFYQLAMVVFLSKSFREVRERREESARGFEAIAPQRVLPVEQGNRGQIASQQGTTDER